MKKSSFKFLALTTVALIIAGILLISATNAYWVKEMEVKIEIDNYETSNKEITKTIVKGEEVKINFRAMIDCQSQLDILMIDKDGNVFLIFSSDSPGNYRNGGACEIRNSFPIIPEETTEHFDVIFLSPGIDNYGMNKKIQELLEDWQSVNIDGIIEKVRTDTANFPGSNDLMAVREIIVKTEEPKADINWTIRNNRLEIYGTTNLPEDTIIEWRFVDPFISTEGNTEVNWNRNIKFTIDNVGTKEIKGNLILEKDGKFIAEETIIWPIPTPTTEKSNELPVSTSYSPEILETTPSPISKPWPSPTIIPGILEEPETPGMSGIASIFAIITVATIIIKRKNNFREQ